MPSTGMITRLDAVRAMPSGVALAGWCAARSRMASIAM